MAANDVDITVIGWTGNTPKLHLGADEDAVPYAQFRLGRTGTTLDRSTGDFRDTPTDWYTVKCFRDLARNVAESIRQGDPVTVTGRLRVEGWTTAEGEARTSAVIYASTVGPDLRWGSSRFVRTVRDRPEAPEGSHADDHGDLEVPDDLADELMPTDEQMPVAAGF